jgi:transposase
VARARAQWWTDPAAGIGGIDPKRLVFLDECGVQTNMARLYGRSRRGHRAYSTVPFGHRKGLTVLGAMGMEGMIAAMTVEAAANGTIFVTYLEQVLLPELRRRKPDAVLVMDNLRVHKTAQVRAALDRSEFVYRYLPAYSPDFCPMEPAWAKVKSALRRVGARTTESLQEALGPALASITHQDAVGYFRHCGYSCLN